jgi:hypothetical protein
MIKMIYHFLKVEKSDIEVEGDSPAECLHKALELRDLQCKTTKIDGEILP